MSETRRAQCDAGLPGISVIVIPEGPRGELRECVSSLAVQDPAPTEIIIVSDGGARSPRGQTTSVRVRDVISQGRGTARRRNTAAAAAVGDVLAFLSGDARTKPGWTAALKDAFRDGATIVAGAIETAGGNCAPPSIRRQHDLFGRRDFLPSASSVNLAISRQLFEALGGFDAAAYGAEDRDFSFRAQLAGHRLTAEPDAAVVVSGNTRLRGARGELRFARSQPALRQKYAYFAFHDALRAWRGRPTGRGRRGVVHTGGEALGWIELVAGMRPWPTVLKPSSGFQEVTVRALPKLPSLALVGAEARSTAAFATATLAADLAVPPPGLLEEALPRWDEPAPWTMRMARLAIGHGWGLRADLVARRLELERPATWGEACLALHGIYAWAGSKDRFALTISRAAKPELVRRFPGLPILEAIAVPSQCRP